MTDRLDGMRAIVTGAARGIGRAIAEEFLAEGARVLCVDENEETLERLYGDPDDDENGRARIYAGRLSERLAQANLVSLAADAFGGVDMLINAHRPCREPEEESEEDRTERGDPLEIILREYVLPLRRLSMMVAERLMNGREATTDEDIPAGRRGAIVNLIPISAMRLQPGHLAKTVGVGAVEHLTRALALELAPRGIRVNAVAWAAISGGLPRALLDEQPAIEDAALAATPLGRIGKAEEAARVVRFLASPEASFVTGQILAVDGGRLLLDPGTPELR